MLNPDQEEQDQRTNSGMEDSSTMTVEFLRARLLSERSVSRSAKQRVEELAKRVVELEEQLKIVSLQRKRAEKATVDVLAILESQGLTDVSEEYDLSTDEETSHESKVIHKSTKEEEHRSFNSKIKSEDLSGSDLDSSPVRGRSLSWKGRNHSPRSFQKYKDSSMRRRSSLASTDSSSPKHHFGKSCRQIRRREAGSVVEEFKTEPVKVGSEENGVASSSEGFPICSNGGLKEGSKIQEKVVQDGPLPGCLENHRNVEGNDLDCNGYGRDRDMEKALEDQAQLIGQYEEMEKAQREWEEKFRENSSSTPDSCDPGNHSDVTEDRDDIKAQAPHLAETVASYAEEEKSEVRDVRFPKELSEAQPNGVLQPSSVNVGGIQHQNNVNSFASESSTQEFAFPMAKEMQNEERQETYHYKYLHNLHNEPHSHGSPRNQSVHSSSSVAGSSFQKGNTSGSQNDHFALVPHQPSDRLSSVLDSLKQARVSLQNKFNQVPLIEGRSVAKPSVPAMNPGDRMEIPVGCAGLFRLPTDYSVEANMQGNFLDSGLSTTNYYRNKGVAITAGDRFVASPYLETRSDISTSDPYFTSQTLSRYSSEKPRFDPFMDTVLSSSTRYTNSTQPSPSTRFTNSTQPSSSTRYTNSTQPSYPSYPTYPGTMPRMPPSEGFSRTFSTRTVGVPPADNMFYDGHGRSNMYM
ncbi:hypothetical protein ACB098_11G104000 [Castanea mollissima]|uniref:Uncharacterized protein n=1 Tax=Castanea mollissima TaxID=60419 RepID=A0A8J4RF09_9ROSI|nr:hypothetical protein CMV_004681 [Castanea mollissima]